MTMSGNVVLLGIMLTIRWLMGFRQPKGAIAKTTAPFVLVLWLVLISSPA
jgi:hypothetical protein